MSHELPEKDAPSSPPAPLKSLALGSIRFYQQAISPHLPPSCRFTPSCSTYAAQAIQRFGVMRGSFLAVKRISRCHPFHPGGYDPVPELPGAAQPTTGEERES